jgi:hypothetical protein
MVSPKIKSKVPKMQNNLIPWHEIVVPTSEFNVRLASHNLTVPVYWGRDSHGAYLFIVELQGDFANSFKHDRVFVKGIEVDLRSEHKNWQRLILRLSRAADLDLYEILCTSILNAVMQASDSIAAYSIIIAQLKRWRLFLSGSTDRMSEEAVRGLFAELMFLQELMDHFESPSAAVNSWLGPEGLHQDFVFGSAAVEVKSLMGSERSTVRISSEDQLESINEDLFLRIYRLTEELQNIQAPSLNDAVARLIDRIADPDVSEQFVQKLIDYGYSPLPDYDLPRFGVGNILSFRVAGDFPRIVRSQLPVGIADLKYNIQLEHIAPYSCENNIVFTS